MDSAVPPSMAHIQQLLGRVMDARLPDHCSTLHWHRELSRTHLRKIRAPRILNLTSYSKRVRAGLILDWGARIRVYRTSGSFGMEVAMKNNLRRHSFIKSTLSKPIACVLGSFSSRFP